MDAMIEKINVLKETRWVALSESRLGILPHHTFTTAPDKGDYFPLPGTGMEGGKVVGRTIRPFQEEERLTLWIIIMSEEDYGREVALKA